MAEWAPKPDSPIKSKSEDRFGRLDFAEKLAKALVNYQNPDSLVIALEGPWGSGKTSLLNLLEECVKAKAKNNDNSWSTPIIVRFNPWWFSRKDDLFVRFFNELANAVGRVDNRLQKLSQKLQKLSQGLRKLAAMLRPLTAMYPSASFVTELIKFITNALAPSQNQKSLEEYKHHLTLLLLDLKMPIWVIIDDLDRLFPEEILQMLSLIRGVGDLPYLRYVLAYDRQELTKRLAKAITDNAQAADSYLSKIVQLSYRVSPPSSVAVRAYFASELEALLDKEKLKENEEVVSELQELVVNRLSKLLITPRDAKRLANSFFLSYSTIGSELHPADLLALEAVRLYFPKLYEELPLRKDLFLNSAKATFQGGSSATDEQARHLEQALREELGEERWAIALDLLGFIFPRFEAVFSNTAYGDEWDVRWNNERRAQGPKFFDAYFQFALPPDVLSGVETHAVKELVDNPHEFANFLLEKSTETIPGASFSRAFLIVEWLLQNVDLLTDNQARLQSVLRALFQVGDRIAMTGQVKPSGLLLPSGFEWFISSLVFHILKRAKSKDQVFNALKDIFRDTQSIHCMTYTMRLLAQSSKPEVRRPLSTQQLDELKRLAATRLEQAARNDELSAHTRLLLNTLYGWKEITGSFDAPRKYVATLVRSPSGLVSFLKATVVDVYQSDIDNRRTKTRVLRHRNIEAIEHFASQQEIETSIQETLSNPSVEPEIKEFLRWFQELPEKPS